MLFPIFDPAFWRERYEKNPDEIHRTVYHCSEGHFQAIAQAHKNILSRLVQKGDTILDVGCGYGRLLDLLPEKPSMYVGFDLSPELIEEAKKRYPLFANSFLCYDIREVGENSITSFTWAVLISIKQMVIGNAGQEAWENLQTHILKFCDQILILEYTTDENEYEIIRRQT
jgi:SAM-dependent methyltransferase